MEPFNIRTRQGNNKVTFIIIPADNGDFEIMYYAGEDLHMEEGQ